MYGGVHEIHSLIFEILVNIQNDIFGDYFADLFGVAIMRLKPAMKLEIISFIVV